MGRKNFESIPHKYSPLPNRTNIVISRQPNYTAKGCVTVKSIEEALQICKKSDDNEPFIIGGGQIYKLALEKDLIDKIYLTRIMHNFDGDTFFPELGKEWKEISRIDCRSDEKHAYNYSFLTFKKNN